MKCNISSNFYALSTKLDVLDEEKTDWFVTPLKEFADFTALANLPSVSLKVKSKFSKKGESQIAAVTLENPTPNLAFMVELRVIKNETGESVLPIFWEDNYFSLLPGEKRTIEGSFYTEDLTGNQPEIRVGGWNIK